jgi:hypothetical protein
MKTIYYKKEGRKYVPVSEYDSQYHDSFPFGDHLVSVRRNVTSRRFCVDPAIAPMLAAGLYAEDAISSAVQKASELRPSKAPITEEQRDAWKHLAKTFGTDMYTLNHNSARDIAEAGVMALTAEADKLLSNPAVKKAYDHFMLLCKLTYEESKK